MYGLLPLYMPNPAPGIELGAKYSPHCFNGLYMCFGFTAWTTILLLSVNEEEYNNNNVIGIIVAVVGAHAANDPRRTIILMSSCRSS